MILPHYNTKGGYCHTRPVKNVSLIAAANEDFKRFGGHLHQDGILEALDREAVREDAILMQMSSESLKVLVGSNYD